MLIIVSVLIGFYVIKSLLPSAPDKVVVGTRAVPMAGSDIPAGTLITSEHLVLGRLSTDKLERNHILRNTAIIGRYALTDIKQAQPIRTSDLYAPGNRPALKVGAGMRAVTIGLGDSTAVVDGLIKPGDYVDVHMTIDNNLADKRYRGGFTTTMFKGVRVIAMNRLTQQSTLSRGANTVTFELTPAQANILLQAQTKGTLSVTYTPSGPGTGGIAIAEADRAYFDEILGLPEIPERDKPFTTEIYRGSNRSVINYDDEYRNYDNDSGRATPWVEQPGWAPPRIGNGSRGYNGGGYNNYRGTQNEQGGSIRPGGGGQRERSANGPRERGNVRTPRSV